MCYVYIVCICIFGHVFLHTYIQRLKQNVRYPLLFSADWLFSYTSFKQSIIFLIRSQNLTHLLFCVYVCVCSFVCFLRQGLTGEPWLALNLLCRISLPWTLLSECQSDSLFLLLIIYMFLCLHVGLCARVLLETRGLGFFWSWSYLQLWAVWCEPNPGPL